MMINCSSLVLFRAGEKIEIPMLITWFGSHGVFILFTFILGPGGVVGCLINVIVVSESMMQTGPDEFMLKKYG